MHAGNDEPARDETVFQPSQPEQPVAPETTPAGGVPEGTVIAPGAVPPPAEGTVIAPATQHAPPPPPSPPPLPSPPPPPRSGAGIEVGSVLNHMFEVTRFLARGGMGEVFEGVNITNGEKVAIKVILPALAADPNVIAMFRKEAQALTRLSHSALVRYRVQAQEPQLGCFYIVTGYIEGMSLSDAIGRLSPSEEELIGLTRRLAEGLKDAHELGVVHRDISPDNVLFEGDRLDRARIIDFGIAKDTDPDSGTIIGDGFAGKPSYVAPEQLGDFDKNVGPWSDIYSLALVILALAQGRKPDLGGLPAEAIMKRRNGVDTSAAPPALRTVLDRMLAADPSRRLRSMDDVIAALDAAAAGRGKTAKGRLPKPPKPVKSPVAPKPTGSPAIPRPVLIGGGAALAAPFTVMAIVFVIAIAFGGGKPPGGGATATPPASTATVPLARIDEAVQQALPGIPCSWITVSAMRGGGGLTLTGEGVARNPVDSETGVTDAVRRTGAEVISSDFSGISPLDPVFCPVIDALTSIRAGNPQRFTMDNSNFEIGTMADGESKGKLGARAIINIDLDGIPGDFSIYTVDRTGVVEQIIKSRDHLHALVAELGKAGPIQKTAGEEHYRLQLDYIDSTPGRGALILLTGRGGFTPTALGDLASPAGKAAFAKAAAANGWKAEMAWYKFVDNVPND